MPRALMVLVFAACAEPPPAEGDPDEPPCADVFYADADGDGHGDPTTAELACVEPSGFTTTRDDCDDGAADVHPGAAEVCNGLDDDCDGSADLGAIDPTVYYLDRDGDGFGD